MATKGPTNKRSKYPSRRKTPRHAGRERESIFLPLRKNTRMYRRRSSKITLSPGQLDLLTERRFFIRKKQTTLKLFQLLASVRQHILERVPLDQLPWPAGMDTCSGKIYRGENYLGYPYVLLDFPRLFTHEEMVVFRTMVWWGHTASCTFLIKGSLCLTAQQQLLRRRQAFLKPYWYVGIHDSPWHHHFKPDNVARLRDYSARRLEQLWRRQSYLKVVRRIPLRQLNTLPFVAATSLEQLSSLLQS